MLKLEHISAGYGKKRVIFDISFHVKNEDILLLVGSNGSGKSTLLKSIYGLIPLWDSPKFDRTIRDGEAAVIFNNESIKGLQTSKMLKKGLIYIPQSNNLFEDLTVRENLEISGQLIGNSMVLKERIENVLTFFLPLMPQMKIRAVKLSGGERKLLTLAMALIHTPKMILIDEPFAGLSEHNIKLIMETIKSLNVNSKITFLIIEHRIREGLNLANRVIGLKLGRIVADYPVNDCFPLDTLTEIYL